MTYRSIRTALLFSAAAIVVGGGCGSFNSGNRSFVQTWGEAAPNENLAQFFDEGVDGDKISLTQHTGSMILSGEDVVDILFGTYSLDATADAADDNPMHLILDDALEFPKVSINSVGTFGVFDVVVIDSGTPDERLEVEGYITNDDLEGGDDILELTATSPGVFEVNDDGDPLDYMSMVGWTTTKLPDIDATSLTLEFGFGHLGLVTPEDDMPVEGEAFYAGIFEGIYVEPGAEGENFIGDATGLADFTANFGDASVVGGASEISVVGSDAGGDIAFDEVTISGNTFSGNVVPGEAGFADFHEDSTGAVDGAFYGPLNEAFNGPEEAGAALTLQDAGSGAFITGVIGANGNLGP
jgi:hypothetical protein